MLTTCEDVWNLKCYIYLTCILKVHMPAVAGYKSMFVGRELLAKQGYAVLSYPLKKGIVIDWDGLEEIWKCIVQVCWRIFSCHLVGLFVACIKIAIKIC